jgi:hypothetical protein
MWIDHRLFFRRSRKGRLRSVCYRRLVLAVLPRMRLSSRPQPIGDEDRMKRVTIPDKSGTSCYHLVTRLMTATGLLRVVPTSYKPIIYTGCSWQVATVELQCCHQLVNNSYVQTISDLLEQLVASLLASSTLLQDDSNLFQTTGNKQCERIFVGKWDFLDTL